MNRNLDVNRFTNRYNITIANDNPPPSPIFKDKRNFGEIFGKKNEKRKAVTEGVDVGKMVSMATQTDPDFQTKAWATTDTFLSQQVRLNINLIRNCYQLTQKHGINGLKKCTNKEEFLKFKKQALEWAEQQKPATNEKIEKIEKKIDNMNLFLKVVTGRVQEQFDERCNTLKKEFEKVERLQQSQITNLVFVLSMILENKLIMEGSELESMIKKNIELAQKPADKSTLDIVIKNAQNQPICIPKKVTEEIIEKVVETKYVTEEIIEEEIFALDLAIEDVE